MNDIDVLKTLPGRIDPPDDPTRARIRNLVEARTAASGSSATGRRPGDGRRTSLGLLLAAAAAIAVGTLAAGLAVHHWTSHRPVAIQIDPSPFPAVGIGARIPDPNGTVSSPTDLASTVAEFAPAIRLPKWGSFDQWREHWDAIPTSSLSWRGLARVEVVTDMVAVAQCQWAQEWLKASATESRERIGRAIVVLRGIADWQKAAGVADGGYWAHLLDQMRAGHRGPVQLFEDSCSYMGAWGTTVTQEDSKATGDLNAAIPTAQEYLRDGGSPSAFNPAKAGAAAPFIFWSWPMDQPAPARPGAIFIAASAVPGITLVSVSESGTQFCAVVTIGAVVRGTTHNTLPVVGPGQTVAQADPGPVTCSPGRW